MRKYVLDVVYKAAALDEIYKLIQDELDLSKEDLESCKEALRDLGDPDLKFVDTNLPYRQMTAEEAYQFYGDSIECTYYSSSGYKNITLVPSPNRYVYYYSSSTTSSDDLFPSWVYSSSIPYVAYSAHVSDYSQNPSYLGFDISPNVHFSDCNAIRICAATYWGGSGVNISSSAYPESFFNINDGNTLRYTNSPYIKSDGVYSRLGLQRSGVSAFRVLPVVVDYVSDTLGDVSLLRIGFNGGRTDSGYISLYLSAPLINDTAVGGSGISSGTSGGSTIINNNVDMTETNSLLDRIKSGISSLGDGLSSLGTHILDGIASIFVPSEGFMDDQIQEVKDSFVWYEQIQAVGNDLKTVFGQEEFNEAPIVTLHASQMKSSWSGKQYMSEDELVLDFGKFSDYRSSIHTVISVLLWAFFLWRLFARLPDIIHGSGMIIGDGSRIMSELDYRESQEIFNDIESHAKSIFDGTLPEITFSDKSDKIDWRV